MVDKDFGLKEEEEEELNDNYFFYYGFIADRVKKRVKFVIEKIK